MENEQLKRANEIQREIESLTSVLNKTIQNKDREYTLAVQEWDTYNGRWVNRNEFNERLQPPLEFLKEQVVDDVKFIADRIIAKIQKRIAELQKEFDNL